MSTRALKLRSSFVVLVTATILLQYAGATSSSTSGLCTDESAACSFGSECQECVMTATEAGSECTSSFTSDDWNPCVAYSRLGCCQDSYSANDCMGNSDFVVLYTCLANYYESILGGGGECSLTCDYGSEDGEVDDDATATGDDGVGDDGATETDDGVVGDENATVTDDGGVGNYNATATDDDATATDDDATATDDGGVGNYNGTATDDGAVTNDDDASDSSANTGGTSGAGNSSPSVMLTSALGLAFLSAAPVFYVLL